MAPARRNGIVHFPSASPRFPELSSPEWREVRRQPKVAHTRFRIVRQHLLPLGVLTGLTLFQRVELVALVSRLHGSAEQVIVERRLRSALGKARKEAPSRSSNVRKKLQHVADALNHLAEYLDPFEQSYWGPFLLGLGDTQPPRDEQLPLPDQLRAEAARYTKMRLLTASEVASWEAQLAEDDVSTPAVRSHLTVSLFSFFSESCGLSNRESNRRVTRVVNALLGGQLPAIERPATRDQRPGSETVRTRVRRAMTKRRKKDA